MIKLHRVLLAGAILALATSATMAGPMSIGSLQGAGFGVTTDTGDITTATTFTIPGPPASFVNGLILGNGTDWLAGVGGTSGPVTFDVANPMGLSVMLAGGFGTFQYDGSYILSDELAVLPFQGSRTFIINGSINLNGDISTSSLVLTFTQNGDAIGANAIFVVPAIIPEPSSVALAGIGMAAAGLFGLRKRLAK